MEKLPRKYCKPGEHPGQSPEPCVPVDAAVELRPVSVYIVSLEGEIWLQGETLYEDGPMVEQPEGKPH